MKQILSDHIHVQQQNFDENQMRERLKEIEKIATHASIPEGFRLDEKGLWYQEMNNQTNEVKLEIWICSPLKVKAYVRDVSNENWGRLLEFHDLDKNLHEWIMPMTLMAKDGTECKAELLNRGLIIAPGSKSKTLLIEYLQRCQPPKRARCVHQTGWNNDCFVFPNESIGYIQNEKLFYQGQPGNLRAYSQSASLEDWKTLSKLCAGNSRLVFAISVAFAPVFLHLLGEENGGFHFRGLSSTGKTTALKVAASIWGGLEFLQRWRSTSNGLEGISAIHNDSLLCLDEIEEIQPSEMGEVAYMLVNGSGKIRGEKTGEIRKKTSWRLFFLSTGEISLADHIKEGGKKVRAGHEVRVLDIPADTGRYGIFEELHGFEDGSSFSDHVCQLARTNFGTPSREFLKRIVANKASIVKETKEIMEKIQSRIIPKDASGQVVRACKRFCLVAAAGEIATMCGITGWKIGEADQAVEKCFNDWINSRGHHGMQEEAVAIAQVQSFFEKNGDCLFSSWEDNPIATKTINRAGTKKQTEDGIEFFVFTNAFRNEICKGLDHTYVAKVCINKGLLMPDSEEKSTRSERMWKQDRKTTRCYRFTSKVLINE